MPACSSLTGLLQRFEIGSRVFAKRADEIVGKDISFIDIAADFAHIAFFACCFRLRLHVVLVVSIGHGITFGNDSRFRHGTDEHAVRIKIHIILDLQ